MAYKIQRNAKYLFERTFTSFMVKFLFSTLMILLLLIFGFYPAVIVTTIFLLIGIILSSISHDNKLVLWLVNLKDKYSEGFSHKDTLYVLLGFIGTFILIRSASYIFDFPYIWGLVFGFIILGLGDAFASLLLYLKKNRHIVYGTSLEFFILGVAINSLILWVIGLPLQITIFLTVSVHLFHIIPKVDKNLSTVLVTALLYMILFI